MSENYKIKTFYGKDNEADTLPLCPIFDLKEMETDEMKKVITQAAATARLNNYLKFTVWPAIFQELNSCDFINDLYCHQPKHVIASMILPNERRHRELSFVIYINKIHGAHSDTAGKFVVEIEIGHINVLYNDDNVTDFEPAVNAWCWTNLV